MPTNNLYSELQKIAHQAAPQAPQAPNPEDAIVAFEQQKLEQITSLAKTMYPDDQSSQFSFWKGKVDSSALSPTTKESYWKTYETMHPEGKVGAKRDFLDVTKRELDVVSGLAGKEFFLRERLTNTPAWARKELDPILGELSATVANSNYSKAQQIYMKDLDARMGRFFTTAELDPDISSEVHTEDVVKLEQLNLMSLGRVQSGRVGVYSAQGAFYPSFGIQDRSEVLPEDDASAPGLDEQRLIRSLAPNIVRKSVEGNIALRRKTIQSQERTGKTITSNYLTSGAFSMDNWDTAFAMLPDVPIREKILLGLRGEIEGGRIRNDKELAQSIYQAMSSYGNLFKDTNATTA